MKKDIWRANKKRSIQHLAIMKMQMKTTVRFQFTSTSMAKITKTDYTKYWQDMEELNSHGNVKFCSHFGK